MVLPPKQFLQQGVYLAASTIHQAMYHEKIKAPRAESSERCTLIFRFPAGFGTLCFRTGCRASQGLSPQPLLISRYSVVTFSILSLLRQIVKKSITLFIQLSEIDGGFVGFLLQKRKAQPPLRLSCRIRSIALGLLAVQDLHSTGGAQAVSAQSQELFHILHGGDAAGSLDLAAAVHTLDH